MLHKYLTNLRKTIPALNGIDATALLDTKDPQNVPRAVKLLRALAACTLEVDKAVIEIDSYRLAVSLLGAICGALVEPYVERRMSLREQMTSLSRLAHLLMALYRKSTTNFIPGQLYHDSQAMVKNAYLCLAKQRVFDDTRTFFLPRTGTDTIEGLFGEIRTLVASDRNVDVVRLTDRASIAVDIQKTMQEYPQWDRGHRRLRVNGDGAVDHLNEVSWEGDLHVSNLNVAACWLDGQRAAETILTAHGMPTNFANLGGVDMLRPIDGVRYPGVGPMEDTDRSFAGEVTEDRHEGIDCEAEATEGGDEAAINIEDMLDENGCIDDEITAEGRVTFIDVKNKPIHITTVINWLCNPAHESGSLDRLSRVRGFTKPMSTAVNFSETDATDGDHLDINEPVATLLRTGEGLEAKLAMALICVTSFIGKSSDKQRHMSLAVADLPKVKIQGQIVKLELQETESGKESARRFQWNGGFEVLQRSHQSATLDSATVIIPGELCQPIQGLLVAGMAESFPQGDLLNRADVIPAWQYTESDLEDIVNVLFETNGGSKAITFPFRTPSASFPYRLNDDPGELSIREKVQER